MDVRSESSNWAGTDLRAQDDYRIMVGQEVGLMFGYVTEGFYSVDDFESYNPATGQYVLKSDVADNKGILGVNNVRPGFLKPKDLDGDGKISPELDRTIIGRAQAKATGGFGFNAAYKAFDFSSFCNWVVGNEVYNTGRISMNMFYRTSYGGILGGRHISIHHNLYAHCQSRAPRFDGNRNLGADMERADFRNNVIYNWGSNNCKRDLPTWKCTSIAWWNSPRSIVHRPQK